MAKIIPLDNRILIEPSVEVKGSIIRAETVEKKKPTQGMVISVGDGYKGILKKGDVVFYQKYDVEEVQFNKLTYVVATPEGVLAVIR